jgi:hypothetical protein
MPNLSQLSDDDLDCLQRWRKRVVRLWVATMAAAIAIWAVAAAFSTSIELELALAAALIGLVALAAREMHRGACPRCGRHIRFEPRIELPRSCPGCGAAFVPTRNTR